MPTLFTHQQTTRDFILANPRALVLNEPGTGKTASVLTAYRTHRKEQHGGRCLVLCPKAIMEPAWVADCRTFTPDLTIAVAAAPSQHRRSAFRYGTDIVVMNHDGVKWLTDHTELLDGFDFLVIDESTAFKNRSAQRSKAVAKLREHFDHRVLMTGTPMPNGLIDIWHQAFLADDGEALGNHFYKFRQSTHDPVPVMAGVTKWEEKEGSRDAVADLLSHMVIRYRFEDCVDIPALHTTTRSIRLPSKLQRQYDTMLNEALLQIEESDQTVQALNAASLMGKLLQIASGAVYGNETQAHELDMTRYALIAELCAERSHSLVAFQWKHQREGLIRALEQAGIDNFAVIDGEHNQDTGELVERFQAGEYQVLLAQPASAGHGLTLTRARTVIWASPTWNAELYEQFNRRIYRTSQTGSTEVIRIAAADTVDERVYAGLDHKIEGQLDLLELLQSLAPTPKAA